MAKVVGVFETAHTPFCYMPPQVWPTIRAARAHRADVPVDDEAASKQKYDRIQKAFAALREQLAAGRFLDVTASKPRFHGDGRADWDFLVTITYRDWAAVQEHSDAVIARRLYPDQAAFKAEEARRFSLLEAHWDVILEGHELPGAQAVGRRRSPGMPNSVV